MADTDTQDENKILPFTIGTSTEVDENAPSLPFEVGSSTEVGQSGLPFSIGDSFEALPEGVLPPPREAMFNDIRSASILENIRAGRFESTDGKYGSPLPEGTYSSPFEAFQQAEAVYNAYKDSPNVEEDFLGTLIWVNPEDETDRRIVPRPEMPGGVGAMFGGDTGPGFQQNLTNSGRNALRGISKFFESGAKTVFDIGDDTIDSAAMPRLVADEDSGFFDKLVAEEGAAMLAGGGTGGLLFKALSKFPTLAKAGFLAGEGLVYGGAVDEEVDTAFIGDNAFLSPVYLGLDIDPESPEAEQIFRRKLNTAMDVAVTTVGADKVVPVASFLFNAIGTLSGLPVLRKVLSSTAQEEALGQDMLRIVANLDPDDPNYAEAAEELATLLENNKDVVINFNIPNLENVEFVTDTATAMQRAAAEGDAERLQGLVQSFRQLSQQTGTVPNSNLTEVASARPEAAVARTLEDAQAEEVFGNVREGGASQQPVREAIQESADEAFEQSPQVARRNELQAQYAGYQQQLDELLANDESFVGRIEDLYRRANMDVSRVRDEAQDVLVADLVQAAEQMDAVKNANFRAVRELGGEIDEEALFDAMTEILGEDDVFRNIQLSIIQRSDNAASFSTLLDLAERKKLPRMGDDGKQMVDSNGELLFDLESREDALARFTNGLRENDITFGTLFSDIRPALADVSAELKVAGTTVDKTSSRLVESFREFIDGPALEFAVENDETGGLIGDAAEEAIRYFKEDYAPFWRGTGPLAELDRIRVQSKNMGSAGYDVAEVGNRVTSNMINNQDSRGRVTQVLDLANRISGVEGISLSPQSIGDFIIGDVVQAAGRQGDRVAEATGEITNAQVVQRIQQELQRYTGLLRQNFPDEYEQVMDFSRRLDETLADSANTEKLLTEATQQADVARKDIFNNQYKSLFNFDELDDSFKVVGNPYASMEKMLNSPQGMDQINTLLNSGDDIIVRGVKSAFLENLRKRLPTSSPNRAGSEQLKSAQLDALNKETSDLMERGRQIFADNPEFIQGLDSLLELAGYVKDTRTTRSGVKVGSDTNFNQQYKRIIDRQLTVILGPLSRRGAQLRSLSTTLLEKIDPNWADKLIDQVMADPDEFARIIRIAGRTGQDGRRRIGSVDLLTQQETSLLARYLFRAGIYDGPEEEFVGAYADAMEQNLQDATDAQMEELGLQ